MNRLFSCLGLVGVLFSIPCWGSQNDSGYNPQKEIEPVQLDDEMRQNNMEQRDDIHHFTSMPPLRAQDLPYATKDIDSPPLASLLPTKSYLEPTTSSTYLEMKPFKLSPFKHSLILELDLQSSDLLKTDLSKLGSQFNVSPPLFCASFLQKGFNFFDPPKRNKPLVRGGINLPDIDYAELGIVSTFKGLGVNIEDKYELSNYFIAHPMLISSYPTLILKDFISASHTTIEDLFLGKRLAKRQIESLTEEEALELFEYLTSSICTPTEEEVRLEEFLADTRVREIICRASQGPKDYIFNAFAKNKSLSQRDLATLIATDGFLYHVANNDRFYFSEEGSESLCLSLLTNDIQGKIIIPLLKHERVVSHLIKIPANSDGETPLASALYSAIITNKPKRVDALFSNPIIFQHLSSLHDSKEMNIIVKYLMTSIALNIDSAIPLFYKKQVVLDHLLELLSLSTGRDKDRLRTFILAGMMSSFSLRSADEIRDLTNTSVMKFINMNPEMIPLIIDAAIINRNHELAKVFLEDEGINLPNDLILKAIRIPNIWKALSSVRQTALLEKATLVDPGLTLTKLHDEHRLLLATEHLLTRHPLLEEDMRFYDSALADKYQELMRQEKVTGVNDDKYFEILAQKAELENEFSTRLDVLRNGKTSSLPWLYDHETFTQAGRFLGQGVKTLVVELNQLPEVQKDRLLKTHLDDKTSYKKKVIGSKAKHNIGVTSLVSQMAPLSKIVSTSLVKLREIDADIQAGVYPFINCSWGPTQAIDEEKPISIFSSYKTLNELLGRTDVVLIQAAGNEGLSLSSPDPSGEPSGIVYSKLLNRLEPEQLSNLILALNLNPDNTLASSSNTPGYSSKIFQNSLCAQGSRTFWLDEMGHDYIPVIDGGTSSAAPIITGAAAVLKSYKPHFSPIQIKNCFLHSALREFMLYNDHNKTNTHVYECVPKPDTEVRQIPFSFSDYGMGILNLKSAFIYADILDTYLAERIAQKNEAPLTFEEYEILRKNLNTKTDAAEILSSRSSISRNFDTSKEEQEM